MHHALTVLHQLADRLTGGHTLAVLQFVCELAAVPPHIL